MAELAERCGLTRDVISDIENGRKDRYGSRRREITIGELIMIADALGISAYELLPTAARFQWRQQEKMLEQAQAIVTAETRRLGELERDRAALEDKIAETRSVIERQQEIIKRLAANSGN
jgi:transcriptional regulator with XRE-family HTH domain